MIVYNINNMRLRCIYYVARKQTNGIFILILNYTYTIISIIIIIIRVEKRDTHHLCFRALYLNYH